jgi:hypothetical protein
VRGRLDLHSVDWDSHSVTQDVLVGSFTAWDESLRGLEAAALELFDPWQHGLHAAHEARRGAFVDKARIRSCLHVKIGSGADVSVGGWRAAVGSAG